jgi:hypothetical protein
VDKENFSISKLIFFRNIFLHGLLCAACCYWSTDCFIKPEINFQIHSGFYRTLAQLLERYFALRRCWVRVPGPPMGFFLEYYYTITA